MKLLFDSCLSPVACEELREHDIDVVWVGDWPYDPGDPAILFRAFKEKRILVTADKDFGELAVARRHPHCGIVRLVDVAARDQSAVTHDILLKFAEQLAAGAILVVEAGRTRIHIGDDE